MSKRLFILGSTGSIGCSTVEVVQHLRALDGEDSWPVIGLAAGTNFTLLKQQAELLGVDAVSLATDMPVGVKNQYANAVELLKAHAQKGDIVVAAIVGFAGIAPVLAAIECGCDIALANKESLVSGGQLVMDAVQQAGVRLLPVDSEHSAIFQSIANNQHKEIAKIILTASGGSLRGFSADEMSHATVDQVLHHPTWTMGAKVTVDSASLMNKALELVEAHWLFGMESERLDAIIHPQSIVHGMVEFCDGSVIAQMSPPDMRLPIQYALTYPDRCDGCSPTIDWSRCRTLDFEEIDLVRFPAIDLAHQVIQRGGTAGAILNAANEVVVQQFLEQKLPFGSMLAIVQKVLEEISIIDVVTIDSVTEADEQSRAMALQIVTANTIHS